MTTAVLIPWRGGCPYRAAALNHTLGHLERRRVLLGTSPRGPFSRTQAILDARRKVTRYGKPDAEVFVVMDGDVIPPDLTEAIDHATETGWAIPHRLIHRLSPESTVKVLDGADWRGLPLSTDNRQDSKPYSGHPTGTLVVLTREAFETAPPDPRFVGWGQEDDAWSLALHTLVGKPWRGDADLVHLWHPPQPRLNRRVGSEEGRALHRRYVAARNRPEAMRALLDEHRPVAA